ncbi:hypothetical protein [Cognatiyoonia sp. IB215182]|uniref:hypothetical protein n=1 Tax=Cognatiyoonia sp. IB215182 TaxID=3097353 RepID=UPI002A146046|nr:hypothetical protein [Cognatiyoonia sp. IB215182]MDX8352336.1 hypothetical protein [Cognatiyoonia sp. IB215182]
MSIADFLLGFLVAGGFFVSAAISRLFRRTATGIIVGGVMGIAFSVVILRYGLADQFDALMAPVGE